MSVEIFGYLEQTKSASGIARKSREPVVTSIGGLKGVRFKCLRQSRVVNSDWGEGRSGLSYFAI